MPLPLASAFAPLVLLLASNRFAPNALSLQEADAARLVPADATILVRVESARALNELVHAFAPLAGDEAASFDLQSALAQAAARGAPGGPVPELEPSLPLYLALSFADGPEPARTVVVPVVNDAPLTFLGPLIGQGQNARLGRYVGGSTRADYAASAAPNPLVASLRPGVATVHLDLAKIIATYRPLLDMALRQAETSLDQVPARPPYDIQPFMEQYIAFVRSLLDTAQSLDLTLEREGEELVLRVDYAENVERTPLATTDVAGLLGYVDRGSALQMVFNGKWTEISGWYREFADALVDAYPEPLRGNFRTLLDTSPELDSLLAPGLAMALDFGKDGMHGTYVLRSPQPQRVVEVLERMLRGVDHEGGLLRVGAAAQLSAGGFEARVLPFEVRYDELWQTLTKMAAQLVPKDASATQAEVQRGLEAFLGRDQRLALATRGELVGVVVASGDANVKKGLERLGSPTAPSPELTRLLARLEPGTVGFVYRLEMGQALRQMFQVLSEILPAGATPPVLPDRDFALDYFGGRHGRVWSGGMVISVGELIDFVRSVQALEQH